MMNAAARVTTPRMPAHPTRKALGAQPAAPRLEVSSSGTRSAKIQISRIAITVTRTAAHTSAIHPSGRSEASSDSPARNPSTISARRRTTDGFQSERKLADALDECGEFGIGRGLVAQEPSPQPVVFAIEKR